MKDIDLLQLNKDRLLVATLSDYPKALVTDTEESWRFDLVKRIIEKLDFCFYQNELDKKCFGKTLNNVRDIITSHVEPDEISIDANYGNSIIDNMLYGYPEFVNKTNLRRSYYRFAVMDVLTRIASAIDDLFPPLEDDTMSPGEALRYVADEIFSGKLINF